MVDAHPGGYLALQRAKLSPAFREVLGERLGLFGIVLPSQCFEGKLVSVEADRSASLLVERARPWSKPRCNADTDGALLAAIGELEAQGRTLLPRAAERLGLSARAWHRALRVARPLVDLDGSVDVRRLHIAGALSCRRAEPRQAIAA